MRKLLFSIAFLLLTALAAPRLVVEPEDGLKPLLDLIASAQEEILVKMYLWTPSRLDVVEALGEAVARGVKVNFAVAPPQDLPHLVLAFERLDLGGETP
ncbi:MAG: hypothetical protein ACK41R_07575 [Thermus sp.]